MVNDNRPVFLCCTMGSLFRRKVPRSRRMRLTSQNGSEPDNTTPLTRPTLLVTQPSYQNVDSNRRIFSLEDLVDRAAQTPPDTTAQELAERHAMQSSAVHELAGRQAVLHERVARLEKKLGKQEMYCKQLAGMMRNDTRRLNKQILELQHKVGEFKCFYSRLRCAMKYSQMQIRLGLRNVISGK